MVTVKDRLKTFLKYKGLGQNKFEKTCGISNGYVNNLKESPSTRILKKIFDAYPELNTEWLLSGTGSMLLDQKESNSQVEAAKEPRYLPDASLIAELRQQIADKDAEIKYLRSLVSSLTGHSVMATDPPALPHVEDPETDLRLKFFDELRDLVRTETTKAINEKIG